jgi:AcrB/AcrD/AcrF family
VKLKLDAIRELGLSTPQVASSLRACVNGDTATYWTTRSGDQVEVTLRLNQSQRERLEQLRTLPVAFAKDGTPISLDSVATIESVFNPEIIRRQNLQRREAVFAGVKDRTVGEVGDDVQELIKETILPPGYSFDVGGQLQQQGSLRRPDRGDGPGGDLHLHRARQPVRQLHPADCDHGLASAGADRRHAGAAALAQHAQRVLDDRPGDADGPGDEERDPAGGLCEADAQERLVRARRAAASRLDPHAPDRHEQQAVHGRLVRCA